MDEIKKIDLGAHDGRKRGLIERIKYNYETLIKHCLISMGTTGRIIEEARPHILPLNLDIKKQPQPVFPLNSRYPDIELMRGV